METESSQDWVGAQATAAELLRQQNGREAFNALVPPFGPQTLEQAYASQDAFVQQQAPGAFGLVVEPFTGGLPWLDITAIEENLMAFHACEGIGNIDFPGTDRFDLSAFKFQPSFVFIEDGEISTGLAVGGDFSTH